MSDKLKFVIPGKPEYLTMIRLTIGSIAAEADFNIEDAEDIKMAVAEACKNICCHGNEGFAEKIEVDCEIEKGKMVIIVTDISDGQTIKKVSKPCLDCPKEGDLGVYVIKTLMNEVEISNIAQGNKSIKMVKVNG